VKDTEVRGVTYLDHEIGSLLELEASVISAIGGVIGIILGFAAAQAMRFTPTSEPTGLATSMTKACSMEPPEAWPGCLKAAA